MSQHDLDIASGRGIDVRADINDAIKALASNFSGPVAPVNPQPCMWWSDTAANKLKRRNSANSAWIDCGPIDRTPFFPTDMIASAGGTADAITASFTPAVMALVNGLYVCVRATGANTSVAPTFTPAPGSIAAKAIVKWGGVAMNAGDIYGTGHWIELQYDATLDKWVLLNPSRGLYEVPPGTVIHIAGSAVPAGWLKSNGALVSRTAYAALFAAIGTTYGAGDGATTFALPDLRGEFMRALDDGRGVDSGRVAGSFQDATAISDYVHSDSTTAGSPSGVSIIMTNIDGAGTPPPIANINYPLNAASSGGANSAYGQIRKIRPRNVAMLALIKY